jgi:hypothetical protein
MPPWIKNDTLGVVAGLHALVATRARDAEASFSLQPKLKSVVDPQEQLAVP